MAVLSRDLKRVFPCAGREGGGRPKGLFEPRGSFAGLEEGHPSWRGRLGGKEWRKRRSLYGQRRGSAGGARRPRDHARAGRGALARSVLGRGSAAGRPCVASRSLPAPRGVRAPLRRARETRCANGSPGGEGGRRREGLGPGGAPASRSRARPAPCAPFRGNLGPVRGGPAVAEPWAVDVFPPPPLAQLSIRGPKTCGGVRMPVCGSSL